MSLAAELKATLTLPVICAPMFLVSGPRLVSEACKAGLVGALPVANARGFEQLQAWLVEIDDARTKQADSGGRVGPLAINLSAKFSDAELGRHFELFKKHGVKILITVGGDPTSLIARAHDSGFLVFHDITSLRFAEKAIKAGADGLICIGAGGGGHSGTISHLALIRTVRSMFDGVIVMAGAVTDGATVRAAEVLGADFAYMGTRFIATAESDAPDEYKKLLVTQTSADLAYTGKIAGVPANWLVESIRRLGLDLDTMAGPSGGGKRHDHLPEHAKPWATIWSAGQGIDLIDDIPKVSELVMRLRREYVEACRIPDMAKAANGAG